MYRKINIRDAKTTIPKKGISHEDTRIIVHWDSGKILRKDTNAEEN